MGGRRLGNAVPLSRVWGAEAPPKGRGALGCQSVAGRGSVSAVTPVSQCGSDGGAKGYGRHAGSCDGFENYAVFSVLWEPFG